MHLPHHYRQDARHARPSQLSMSRISQLLWGAERNRPPQRESSACLQKGARALH